MPTPANDLDTSSRRLVALDATRGVAAVVVCVHHTLLTVPVLADAYFRPDPSGTHGLARLLTYSPLHLLWEGTGAVLLFFVLSGFVLVRSMDRGGSRDKQAAERWLPYYAKRLLRLYLPVWCVVAFAWLLAVLIDNPHTGSIWLAYRHAHGGSWGAVAPELVLLGNPGQLISPLWSLKWEVVFSLLLPLYVLVTRWRALALPLLIVSFWSIDVSARHGNKALTYLPMFLVGAIIAANLDVIRRWGRAVAGLRFANVVWAVVLVAAAIPVSTRWIPGYVPRHWMMTTTMASAIVVVAALESRALARILSRPLLVWLGAISFSLYLVHEPTLVAVSLLIGPGHALVSVPLSILASLGVATFFYYVVERRLHRVAKRAGDIVARCVRRDSAPAHVAETAWSEV